MNHDTFLNVLFSRVPRADGTRALVVLNVLVFLLTALAAGSLMQFPSDLLIRLGGNFAPLVQKGEAWRLATALFLHGGLLHVSLNMLALHQVGQVVERLYGRSGFLVIYVGAGLLGNLASLWWKQSGVSVGASGAIFGVYGALLAYLTAQRGSVPVQIFAEMRSGTLGFIGYSLFAGFAVPGIDNAAHVGGLLGGLLLGATLARPLVEPDPVRWQSPLAIGGLAVALVLGGVLWIRTPQVVQRFEMNTLFQQNAQQFSVEEQDLLRQQALLMDNLRHRRVTAVQALDTLDNDLIPRWDRQIGVLSDHLAAPEQDWQRVELIHYATARRDALKALAQAISTRQAAWVQQANDLEQQANNILLQMRLRNSLEASRR